MSFLRSLAMCLSLLAACLLFAPEARASTECTATMTGMNFGPVSSTANTEAAATLTVHCSTSGFYLFGGTTKVRLCFNIGDGVQGGGLGIVPRRMTNSFGDAMQFQLYKNAVRTDVWGSRFFAPTPLQLDLQYGLGLFGGSDSATATMYGRVPLQSALAAGSYQNQFFGAHTSLDYRYTESIFGSVSSCTSGGEGGGTGGQSPFTATATVAPNCQAYATTDLDFGSVSGLITTNKDQTSTLSMTCTGRTAWNVGMNNGLIPNGTIRRMQLGATANYVNYELYRDPGRVNRWGSTIGTNTVPGTGTGSQQTLTVYGRVPAAQTVPAGNYSDIITVTISY